jgi:hypothetical protein
MHVKYTGVLVAGRHWGHNIWLEVIAFSPEASRYAPGTILTQLTSTDGE